MWILLNVRKSIKTENDITSSRINIFEKKFEWKWIWTLQMKQDEVPSPDTQSWTHNISVYKVPWPSFTLKNLKASSILLSLDKKDLIPPMDFIYINYQKFLRQSCFIQNWNVRNFSPSYFLILSDYFFKHFSEIFVSEI